ncbi:MAG: hypothetical protein [Wendovervirus sonii]|uniref:Uncharacterized protein n=1 Tax=phage Lak_Megaphage_Sonny TaxID=3109229 RepID=A0ABZ0Z4C6_9CAUD|nr:MAG: hypothetical protein [phage Lak_Megaphage_Sonny]
MKEVKTLKDMMTGYLEIIKMSELIAETKLAICEFIKNKLIKQFIGKSIISDDKMNLLLIENLEITTENAMKYDIALTGHCKYISENKIVNEIKNDIRHINAYLNDGKTINIEPVNFATNDEIEKFMNAYDKGILLTDKDGNILSLSDTVKFMAGGEMKTGRICEYNNELKKIKVIVDGVNWFVTNDECMAVE